MCTKLVFVFFSCLLRVFFVTFCLKINLQYYIKSLSSCLNDKLVRNSVGCFIAKYNKNSLRKYCSCYLSSRHFHFIIIVIQL